jgi:hypothetical protein
MENGEKSYIFSTKGVVLSLLYRPMENIWLQAEEGNHSIVWDLTTHVQVATLEQLGRINAVQFSRDGNCSPQAAPKQRSFVEYGRWLL